MRSPRCKQTSRRKLVATKACRSVWVPTWAARLCFPRKQERSSRRAGDPAARERHRNGAAQPGRAASAGIGHGRAPRRLAPHPPPVAGRAAEQGTPWHPPRARRRKLCGGGLPVREAEIAEQLRRHKSDDLRDLIDLAAATAGSAARLASKRSDEQDVRPSGSSPSASLQARSPTCFARPMPACILGWGWRPSPAAYTLTWQSWPTQRRTFLRRQVRRGPNSSPSGRSSRTSSRGNRARWTAPECPSPPGCSATPTRGTGGGARWAGSWCSR
jgi:hypothetical protein